MDMQYFPALTSATIINSLSTGGTTDALSAEQGKVLDEGKIDKTSIVNDLTTGGATSLASAETVKTLNENMLKTTSDNKTLLSTGWSVGTSNYYEYDLAITGVTAATFAEITVLIDSWAVAETAQMLSINETSTGSIKLYSKNAPASDINVNVKLTSGVTQ